MTQTQRSITALYAMLPDNSQRLLSAEDIRDIVETLRNGHGEYSLSASAETTISGAGTFVKAAGTTVLSADNHNWTMPANNRLTYGGTANRVVHLACSVSFTTANNNKEVRIRIAKNGTDIDTSEVRRFVSTGADVGSTALHHFDDVTPGDFFELFVANMTDTTNLTVVTLNLFIMDMAL